MRLTEYTDYTFRVLIYLGVNSERLVTIQEIADAYGISRNHLMKIAHQLGLQGLVVTTRGRGGGLRLGLSPENILLGQVVRASEPDMMLAECFGRSGTCLISPACTLKKALAEALAAFCNVLDQYSLADLLQKNRRLVRLLRIIPA